MWISNSQRSEQIQITQNFSILSILIHRTYIIHENTLFIDLDLSPSVALVIWADNMTNKALQVMS